MKYRRVCPSKKSWDDGWIIFAVCAMIAAMCVAAVIIDTHFS